MSAVPRFAQVLVDIDAPHLDELFDYQIPESLRNQVQVGSLVQVRFGPRRVNAWVFRISDQTTFTGRVAPLLKVVSPIPVVTEPLLETISYLATRYAVSRSQLLSFVVPTRRARVEKALGLTPPATDDEGVESGKSREVEAKAAPTMEGERLRAVPSRQVRTVLPGERGTVLRRIVINEVSHGHSVLVIVATAALATEVSEEILSNDLKCSVGIIDADQSPDRRYRTYLRALLGKFDVLVGTRSVAWTPLANLATIVIVDDGDDRQRERRAPYLESLDIAVARSHIEDVSLISLAYSRSLKSQALVESGWAEGHNPPRARSVEEAPRVGIFDEHSAQREGSTGRTRLPEAAYRLIRRALEEGPVLIQVPAAGAVVETEDGRRRIGSDRIGEELSRAFPQVAVQVSSSTAGVKAEVGPQPQVVVATPGAEPHVAGGYCAVIITGVASALLGPRLDAPLQALRRWMNALALARPRAQGLLVGDVAAELVDSLVYWDPSLLAHQVWLTHQELGFPPARWMVRLEGDGDAVAVMMDRAQRALGKAELHFPGESFATLTLVSQQEMTAVSGDFGATTGAPKGGPQGVQVIVSVAPRNIQVLMTALARARRDLSRAGRALPSAMVNPTSLIDEA